MKINSKVKVKIHGNWRSGTLLEVVGQDYKVGIGEPHYFNYEEKVFSSNEVKEYVELPEETADKIHAEQLPLVLAMAQEALAALIPNTKVEVIDGSLSSCGLTLDPVVYEKETIGKFIEYAGWQVTFWKYYSATRVQPDEYVDCPIEEPLPWNLAVQLFVRSIFNANAQAYWDAKSDEAYANQEIFF